MRWNRADGGKLYIDSTENATLIARVDAINTIASLQHVQCDMDVVQMALIFNEFLVFGNLDYLDLFREERETRCQAEQKEQFLNVLNSFVSCTGTY